MGIKIFKNEKFLLLTLILFVAFFYKKLLAGFFQQDEWFSFTIYLLHRNLNFIDSLKFFFAPDIGHYNPLTVAAQQILFSVWGMNYSAFAILGIILHLLAVVAVYFLAKVTFNGRKTLAFATSVFFGILASAYQATAWVVADISTLSATLFGVISSTFFFTFLKERQNRFLTWSLVTLIVSLLFKEITLGLFPLFFIIYLVQYRKKVGPKPLWLIGGLGSAYALLRIGMFFIPSAGTVELIPPSQATGKLIYNIATVPLKVLSQSLFPAELIKGVAGTATGMFPEELTGIPGTPEFETFVVKRTMEGMSVSIGLLVIIFVGILYLKRKNGELRSPIVYALGWIIINSFIF
ncbi:hypothetical protein HY502_02600, partial [Candidatus Woesebacteria bacterium]|nr:hypothetical protein [Candidatus Woesebacteria bacterium]